MTGEALHCQLVFLTHQSTVFFLTKIKGQRSFSSSPLSSLEFACNRIRLFRTGGLALNPGEDLSAERDFFMDESLLAIVLKLGFSHGSFTGITVVVSLVVTVAGYLSERSKAEASANADGNSEVTALRTLKGAWKNISDKKRCI